MGSLLPQLASAGDNLFNSGAVIKEELSRVSDEGKLFIQAPVDPYLAQTAAVAAAFAAGYLYDRDIRSDLSGIHSRKLNGLADFGSLLGNPFVHLGVAAAVYTGGVVAEAPALMSLGQEVGEALLFADGTTFLLKEAVGRARPQEGRGNSQYRPFQFSSGYDSLPSMHTASSFAVAEVLASRTESLSGKILCYTAAGLVAFSRLYQEKHWTSDIVLGAAIGELAGNSVTRYYALHRGDVSVTPAAIDGVPSLSVVGSF